MGSAATGAADAVFALGGGALAGLSEVAGKVQEGIGALLTSDGGLEGLAAGSAAAAGAFALLGGEGAQVTTQMMQISAVLGLPIDEADKLALAFQDTGSSAQSLIRLGTMLSTVMSQAADAIQKGNEPTLKARVLTDELGISIFDSSGKIRGQGEVLQEVLGRLGAMTNQTEAARLAAELWGSRIAGQIIPVIANWSSVSASATEQEQKLAGALDPANAIKFHTEMTTLQVDFEALSLKVLPPLISVLQGLNSAIDTAASHWSLLHGALGVIVPPLNQVETGLKATNEAAHGHVDALGLAENVGKSFALSLPFVSSGLHDGHDAWNLFNSGADQGTHSLQGAASATHDLDENANELHSVLPNIGTDLSNLATFGSAYSLELQAMVTKQEATIRDSVAEHEVLGLTQQALVGAREEWIKFYDAQGIAHDRMGNLIVSTADLTSKDLDEADAKKREADALRASNELRGVAVDLEGKEIPTKAELVDKDLDAIDAKKREAAALAEANRERGIEVDLEGKEIPTQAELVSKDLDAIDAKKREAQALREANLERGIETNLEGQALPTKQELINRAKDQILASKAQADATAEARKELGLEDTTAKGAATSLTAMTDATKGLSSATSGLNENLQSSIEHLKWLETQKPSAGGSGGGSGGGGSSPPPSSGGAAMFPSYIVGGVEYTTALNYQRITGRIPTRDIGGPVAAGSPYLIGPQEIFVPDTSGVVYPMTSNGGGGGMGSQVLYVDLRGAQVMSDRDLDMLIDKVGRRLAQNVFPQAGIVIRR